MKAAIVGSGTVDNYTAFIEEIKNSDLIICADGGIEHLIKMGISPNVFIGDFDSCNKTYIKELGLMHGVEIIEHKPEKNDTDMQLCIDYALDNGCDHIVMFAALGGRVDHELSNIMHLKYILERGVVGEIYSYKNRLKITNNQLKITKEDDFNVSLIPLTEKVSGVTLKGLRYPLENAEIIQGTSLGISNEFCDDTAEVFVNDGILLVVLSKD